MPAMGRAAEDFQAFSQRDLQTVSVSQDSPDGDLPHILRSLGERIAELSSRLSNELDEREAGWPIGAPCNRLLATVNRIIATRSERARLFSPLLFSDPAWDILLCLLQAELEQASISFATLTARAKIPSTTAIRWVSIMADRGMLVRRDDPRDARRVFVELHPDTSTALRVLIGSFGENLPS
jgi:DNA-binding MarR family transcriptional regulator